MLQDQDGICPVFRTNNIITKILIKFYIKFKMAHSDMFYACLVAGLHEGIYQRQHVEFVRTPSALRHGPASKKYYIYKTTKI